ncbi:MAG: SGNH/GDSL hydrolase family protein [Negativicutes bacterium]|nr:SGNH/GDSL hydrolase family protein [Negativicutes bacterium]
MKKMAVRLLVILLIISISVPCLASDHKRVLIYGDSNSYGWVPVYEPPTTRYAAEVRWPGVLQTMLGSDYEIIEENLSGRTTDLDQPDRLAGAGLNGALYLPACLASHLPLDMIVIMLGTNDTKKDFKRTPYDISVGAAHLISIVKNSTGGVGTVYPAPKILLVAPPPLGNIEANPRMAGLFAGGREKSLQLGKYYKGVAQTADIAYLDIATVVPKADGIDGVHLSADSHHKIAAAVAEAIKDILK